MKIIDSVAAVFCINKRIFVVRRQSHLKDFPGYDSFPGGKIDSNDSETQHTAEFLCHGDGQKMHALVREIKEELDYDLTAGIASGQVSSVKLLATTLAPVSAPVRFRLHLYRIDCKTGPQFTPDPGEFEDAFWTTPEELLASYHKGDSLMVPALRCALEKLIRDPRGCDFGDLSPQFDEENFIPRIELLSELQILPVPSNTLPPATRTNAFLLGDDGSKKILVDPSPLSHSVLEKLLRTLKQDTIDALLLTHHHPDHHEQAPQLARQLNLPIWMSEETRFRIIDKYGSDYFAGVSLDIKREGEKLTTWKGEGVRVYEVPGHDAGQLGLAPESLRWLIVGDLIQNSGTVVIAEPEGDMAAYFKTLERIIDLDPAVIIPSHGIPMRGTYRIRATLQHRREREKAIYELSLNGKTETEILNTIYPGIDRESRALALQNIKSHLSKLKQEEKTTSTACP